MRLFSIALLLCAVGCSSRAPTGPGGITFVAIPAGEFVMGSPPSEPERANTETQHHVKITRPFWITTTAITVGQFARFVQETGYVTSAEKEHWAYGAWNASNNQWDTLEGASWRNPGFAQDETHPVVCITWNDAQAFCQWLSKKERRTCRLPTEAEWEYACRAGTMTAYPWGQNPSDGEGFLNGSDQIGRQLFNLFTPFDWSDGYLYTSPVARFKPNAWGLYDMLGNTLEWCSDWFAPYPPDEAIDPTGPADGQEHILRGGAFVYGPKHCRSAFRGRNWPEFRNFYIGFRVVCEAK